MSQLRELLNLPQEVAKSAFVVRLCEAVTKPEETLRDYAVTPDIVRSLGKAMTYVEKALRDCQSEAAYIHGSFGTGKSHFMAVLSLLLADETRAWSFPEFHKLRERHEWVKSKKLLRLHCHMIGAHSTEERVFGAYMDYMREHHPEAALPTLFGDEELFKNAEKLRLTMGDDKFFAALNEGSEAKEGWGDFVTQGYWDRDKFEISRTSTSRDDRDPLFSALVRTLFSSFTSSSKGYVGLDEGLARLSAHAAKQGYDAVVLFLDELILWLTTKASEKTFLTTEVAKLSKLVEAQSLRQAPIVSFIARQRDISEMVGDQLAGQDIQALRDALAFWQGRFNEVKLNDSNLPTVVQKRVVRPRDDAARARLEKAFDEMRRGLGQSWAALLGEQGDEKAFRMVYPFSPALIEALVALSHYLQRERTALKVLVELLVEHMDDFELGKVVPVGDLFDVLVGGEEPDGSMRERFVAARRLYLNELLPRIQAENKTGNQEKCQRLRPSHQFHLGCSNCIEGRCRADNRMVKTALLAALVPQVVALRGLTVSRLVQLNHGTLKSPIPGQEATIAAGRLRSWSAEIGKLRVEGESDPDVKIVLEGVDVRPIIEGGHKYYTPGAGRKMLRSVLYEALEVKDTDEPIADHKVVWRGTRRLGLIQYGNVREMDDEALGVPPDRDFKLVIDYPFDEPGHGPEEDELRLEKYLQERASPTVVWLPDFFGVRVNQDLRELVIIEHILGEPLGGSLANFRPEDRRTAREELEHLEAQKKARVRRALEAAYGLKNPEEGDLDLAHRVGRHIHVLKLGWEIRGVTETVLDKAVAKAVSELLSLRFPRHPHFNSITPAKLKGAQALLEQLAEKEDFRLPITRNEIGDWDILVQLGIVNATEAAATLRREWLLERDKDLRRDGLEQAPTVEQLRKLMDPQDLRGLSPEVADLEVWAYALVSRRELVHGGRPVKEPVLGKLPRDVELVRTPLPDEATWQEALTRAGKLFGVAIGGRANNARNLRLLFEELCKKRDEAFKQEAERLPERLAAWSAFLPEESHRNNTAVRAAEFLVSLQTTDPVELVQALGTFVPAPSSLEAIRRHLQHASKCATVLRDEVYLNVFTALRAEEAPAGQAVLERLATVLAADELNEDLGAKLPALVLEAQKLQHKVPAPPLATKILASGAGRGLREMDAARNAARKALEAGGPDSELEFSWKVVKEK